MFRKLDCILTSHGINYQNGLIYIYRFLDLLQLFHHAFVNMKTTGCIQDHYIEAIFRSMFYSGFCNVHRTDLIPMENTGTPCFHR